MNQHQLINNCHAFLKHTFTAALVCTLSAAINPALAENYYIGANIVGQSKSKDIGNAIRDAFTITGISPSVDDKDAAWKLFGGYQANENLGFEAAFIDLGKVKGTGTGITPITVKSKGVAFSVVGTVPVSDSTGAFGKIGLFSWNTDVSAPGILAPMIDDSGVDLTYGIGAKFQFNKQVGVRLDWDRFKLGDADTDMLSVGILFNFK